MAMKVSNIFAVGVMALASAALLSTVALAGNKHVGEALTHAQEAVDHGKQGHADVVSKHAGEALKHAEMAQKDMKNPHLDEGIKGLKDAVKHGNAGHAAEATKAAESAVMHISEAK